MTNIKEHRAWVRAVTKMSDARKAMDEIPFLGIDPDYQRECREIWDRIDHLTHLMVRRVEEMEKELEEKLEVKE